MASRAAAASSATACAVCAGLADGGLVAAEQVDVPAERDFDLRDPERRSAERRGEDVIVRIALARRLRVEIDLRLVIGALDRDRRLCRTDAGHGGIEIGIAGQAHGDEPVELGGRRTRSTTGRTPGRSPARRGPAPRASPGSLAARHGARRRSRPAAAPPAREKRSGVSCRDVLDIDEPFRRGEQLAERCDESVASALLTSAKISFQAPTTSGSSAVVRSRPASVRASETMRRSAEVRARTSRPCSSNVSSRRVVAPLVMPSSRARSPALVTTPSWTTLSAIHCVKLRSSASKRAASRVST